MRSVPWTDHTRADMLLPSQRYVRMYVPEGVNRERQLEKARRKAREGYYVMFHDHRKHVVCNDGCMFYVQPVRRIETVELPEPEK